MGVRGINDTDAIARVADRWAVAQEMIHPFMGFGGKKFHMRLYLLVTRWVPPVRALVYNNGLVFRSRHVYNKSTTSLARDVFSAASRDVDVLPLSELWRTLGENSGEVSAPSIRARIASSLAV